MEIRPLGGDFKAYLSDESRKEGGAEWIAFPRTEEEIGSALRFARERNLPVTVQGGRTGIAAGAVPPYGLVLNLARMNRVFRSDRVGALVQPGVTLAELQAEAARHEAFFPPNPTEPSATVGGMTATCASGSRSFRYGSVRLWIESLRVVLADGDRLVLHRGMKAAGRRFLLKTDSGRKISGVLPEVSLPRSKNAAGYPLRPDMELIDLFIGMEGTLGIVSEIGLRWLPQPRFRAIYCLFLPDEPAALHLAERLRAGGAGRPAAIEFFDAASLELLRRSGFSEPLPDSGGPALYIEMHGDEVSALARFEAWLAREAGGAVCWAAESPRHLIRLEAFRHAVPEAVNAYIARKKREFPGLTKLGTDLSVPDGFMDEMMHLYRCGLQGSGLEAVIFGHIGDNHLHVNILPRSPAEYRRGRALYREWAAAAVARGGSISAEHGIGKLKRTLFAEFSPPELIEGMRAVRLLFDPEQRLAPETLL